MKIDYSPYQLKYADSSQRIRDGALLRVSFDETQTGYADLHSWPELGDPSVEELLQGLREQNFSELSELAIEFAEIDSDFRVKKKNIFEGLKIPKSGFLISDIEHVDFACLKKVTDCGFTHVKVKISKSKSVLELEKIKFFLSEFSGKLKWRLDFNSSFGQTGLEMFWASLTEIQKRNIDYFEDPFEINNLLNVDYPIAIDREIKNWLKSDCLAEALVLKPNSQKVLEVVKSISKKMPKKVTITSYMGHPVGQCQAAYWAGILAKQMPLDTAGLNSHLVYEKNEFSKEWIERGLSSEFMVPKGFGFGFEKELLSQAWKTLC